MSQPYDPYRRPQQPGARPGAQPPRGGYPQQQPGAYRGEPGAYPGQPGAYPGQARPERRPDPGASGHRASSPPPGARPPASQRPAPSRTPERRSIPGLGLILAIVGTLVQLAALFLLPWVAGGGSLATLWSDLQDIGARGFGDWYVFLLSYPLVALSVLLAFSAVLESAAMKAVWAGLMLLGLGYLAVRYGVGPLTGLVGDSGLGTTELVIAGGAIAAAVLVVFVLKMAISTFRRVAGVVLIALGGTHVAAVSNITDLAQIPDIGAGAFTPALGYAVLGVAALIGPRRFIPGA